ncbi:fungal specific transcription factor domain-containing protein [Aspergillus affinis]|uniref:fungal specific transcription factor domain-containing protein n=1 Tax=Aspergillus affinis TaxID=1070780 RepID=UPI0022FE656E|nr:uncharacterized protein KD926_005875 [Aspergillus affinis]KAI9045932.1 hypothetical protein KD926_005875 [Aspergillus affinis]
MGIASNRPSSAAESQNEYFGDSSVASFLKEIKVSDAANSRGDSSSQPGPNLPGTSRFAVDSCDLPSRQLADYLLQCYFGKFHSLYPFIHKPSFLRMYDSLWTPTVVDVGNSSAGIGLGDPNVPSSTFLCALNIVLALGCQFSHLNHTAREATSADIFERSQRYLNTLSRDKGDLALVQILLLTATYLQGGESPSKCWDMIGLACRIAQGLGMHSVKADRNRRPAEIQIRRRVWHGCIMMDL